MKFFLTINGQEHTLELDRGKGVPHRLDGIPFEADTVEVQPGIYSVLLGSRSFSVHVIPREAGSKETGPNASGAGAAGRERSECIADVDGVRYSVAIRDPRRQARDRSRLTHTGRQNVAAPMAGRIIRILATEGQTVEIGQGLMVVEAMKMQNEIKSRAAGTVRKVLVSQGQAVNANETLMIVE